MVKLMGFLYALLGLLFGAVITLISLLGFSVSKEAGGLGLMFGSLAIILFPIFYGIIGVVAGALGALLYNLAARVTGGLDLELE
jgi:hypothetical protein